MKMITAIALTMITTSSFALAKRAIICHTPMKEQIINIKMNKIIVAKDLQKKARAIASVINIRTLNTPNGFTKLFKYKNYDARIHIEDVNKFDESEDYLSLKSKKGHKMTYPITCVIK